jgi:phosphonate dehydrogenase
MKEHAPITSHQRPIIVATHRIFPATRHMLESVGTLVAPEGDEEALTSELLHDAARNADALLAFMPDRVDDNFLAECPKLKIVACALKGYDNFDGEACAQRNIWMSIVPDLLTVPAAELTIGLMIGLARHVAAGDAFIRSGNFRSWRPTFYGRGLAGETIGFVGFGAIGRAIAMRLRAFEMTMIYADPNPLTHAEEQSLSIASAAFDHVLQRADYLIAAAPLTPATLHLLNDGALSKLKPGALLINPSRGSIVDEAAVARALNAGHLGGYAADVFEMEDWHRPDRAKSLPPDLVSHPRTLFTPHLGSAVIRARQEIERRAAENILDCLAGRIPRDAIYGPKMSSLPIGIAKIASA